MSIASRHQVSELLENTLLCMHSLYLLSIFSAVSVCTQVSQKALFYTNLFSSQVMFYRCSEPPPTAGATYQKDTLKLYIYIGQGWGEKERQRDRK